MKKAIRCFAILLFFSILIFINVRLYIYAEDDAYIHFRISENLVRYGQPYYNLNEPVLATSSTVWTILLAGLTTIPLPLPLTVAIMNAIFTGTGGLIYSRIGNITTGNKIIPWIIPIIYSSILIQSSIGLMETPLALLVISFGIYLFFNEKPSSFLFFGLAVFIRLELIIFLIIFFLISYFRRNSHWKSIIYYSAFGTIPFLMFDLIFFHTIIPNTIKAKSIIYQLTSTDVLSNIILNTFPRLQLLQSLSPLWQIIYISVIIVLLGFTILHIKQNRRSTRNYSLNYLLVLAGILVIFSYIVRGVLIFPWYIPLYLVPIMLGLTSIYCSKVSKASLLFIIVFTVPFSLHFVQTVIAATEYPYLYQGFETGARVRNYLQIGEELYQDYPDASLLSSEIGGLGFSFKGHIEDAAGLASPQALVFHPMKIPEERSNGIIGAIPVGFIKEIKPDIIISYDVFIESFLKSKVCKDYVRIKRPVFLQKDMKYYSSGEFWSSKSLNIFYRKDFLLSSIEFYPF